MARFPGFAKSDGGQVYGRMLAYWGLLPSDFEQLRLSDRLFLVSHYPDTAKYEAKIRGAKIKEGGSSGGGGLPNDVH